MGKAAKGMGEDVEGMGDAEGGIGEGDSGVVGIGEGERGGADGIGDGESGAGDKGFPSFANTSSFRDGQKESIIFQDSTQKSLLLLVLCTGTASLLPSN